MKKTEVKEIEFQKDQYGMTMYPIDYSLSMIANMLSNFEHGISRLSVDNNITDETDLRGVESKLSDIQDCISDSSHALYEIDSKLESISESLKTISNGIETFIGWYIENSKK